MTHTAQKLYNALWLLMENQIHRYLMSNANGRWDGAEKALRHIELCQLFLAVEHGIEPDDVRIEYEADFEAVHDGTQALTDHLDEVIGFPLESTPDYDILAPKFFDSFIQLAKKAIAPAGTDAEKGGA